MPLLCCIQLTYLLFSCCSESEILHHDKQYEPFYSSFVALSTHYITTVCGLSKCSPSFPSLALTLWLGYSKDKLELLSFWCLSPALSLNQTLRQRPALLAFVLAECQFRWKGKLVHKSVCPPATWWHWLFGCLFIGLTSFRENSFGSNEVFKSIFRICRLFFCSFVTKLE